MSELSKYEYYKTDLGTLYLGNCLVIMQHFPDNHFDLCLTDPPYGININKSQRLSVSRGFGGETWDNSIPDIEVFNNIFRISNNQVIWGGNYFALKETRCFYNMG